jgi:hypothetical protein
MATCCSQTMCCGCLTKLAIPCPCNDGECGAVIAICPFCRGITSMGAIDIYLGGCTDVCTTCVTAENDDDVFDENDQEAPLVSTEE